MPSDFLEPSASASQKSFKTPSRKGVHFSDKNEEHVFDTSKASLTPALEDITPTYRNPEERPISNVAPESTLSKPNYEDLLKRVSCVILQHIIKCEERINIRVCHSADTGMFQASKIDLFTEDLFVTPKYVYQFVRAPIARMGFQYGIRKLDPEYKVPEVSEIYIFIRDLFIKAQLSAECSIVSLIYVERLMEYAHVPLVKNTWKPCVLCGLLLASKVWQDLSSWNSEFAEIYPEFSLDSINKLEMIFCKEIEWNLYISSSTYAKYYFALRSITEKTNFRRNYNAMMRINAPGADLIQQRTEGVKQAYFNHTLSKSF